MLNKNGILQLISLEMQNRYNLTGMNLAMFLAQCDYESNGFRDVVENLNYSAKGLIITFPKYFNANDMQTVVDYANDPEAIANYVYANRLGNGDEDSGEGWKYRGRGYLQITGKDNYNKFNNWQSTEQDFINSPDLMCQPQNAILSAIWFWQYNGLSHYVTNINEITLRINGSIRTAIARETLYKQYLKLV